MRGYFGIIALLTLSLVTMDVSAATLLDRSIVEAKDHFQSQIFGKGGGTKDLRYAAADCDAVATSDPLWKTVLIGYENLPVQNCTATVKGASGRALLLLPTPEQLAKWTVNACSSAKVRPEKMTACWHWIADFMNDANSYQFVISGTISEPASLCIGPKRQKVKTCVKDGVGAMEVLYTFRDGITSTVENGDICLMDQQCNRIQPTDDALIELISKEPTKISKKGRIAGINRKVYDACQDNGKKVTDSEWREIVRTSMATAWTSDHNDLIDLLAKAQLAPHGKCNMSEQG
ncbi:hypothetical protein [Rhizobium leguminosarum]|uniref:hypothetical protein n=1 Tax=Rhizobium leguminosarum TaxID=384 RepID=UPI001037204E|nr:hypothetical protein [Rhizobium leguminosarum]TBF85691.1 hypothetical protein ELG85_37160 [Rhizobium leguminosarum]